MGAVGSGGGSGDGWCGERDADAGAIGDFGVDPDLAGLAFNELTDGGEPDAAAVRLGTSFVAGEDLLPLVLGDAGAPIADFDFAAVADDGRADADAGDGAGDGVLEGVIDEVLEDADEGFAFAESGGQRVDIEACAGGGELGCEGCADIVDDGVQFDDFAAGVCRLGMVDAVSSEGGFDEALGACGCIDGTLEGAAGFRGEGAV